MLNKILIFGGTALISILVIENLVTQMPAYLFIDASSKGWILSLVSTIIGIGIGYGIKGVIEGKRRESDEYNF